jgi:serine/threonine protein kinase
MYANTTCYCCLHVVLACYCCYYCSYYSHNVLIDDDCRALLTDFGLSKTEGAISTSSTTKSLFHGGTLAWTAPELFNAVRGQTCTQLFTAKSDVYSYGK